MDFELTHILLGAAALAVVVVLGHGLWTTRPNNQLRIKLDRNFVDTEHNDPELSDLMLLRAELPNGGARVVQQNGQEPEKASEPTAPSGAAKMADSQVGLGSRAPEAQDTESDIRVPVESVAMSSSAAPPLGDGSVAVSIDLWESDDEPDADGANTGVIIDPAEIGQSDETSDPVAAELPNVSTAKTLAGVAIAPQANETLNRPDGSVYASEQGVGPVDLKPREQVPAEVATAGSANMTIETSDAGQTLGTGEQSSGDEPAVVASDQSREPYPVVLSVLTKGEMFAGEGLLRTLESLDMKWGEMDIFHRLDERGAIEFSLANAVEPGTFDPDTMAEIQTPGVTLFMIADELADPGSTYENMLMVAQMLADELGGSVKDEQRNDLTDQSIDSRRDSLRGYRLQQA